MVTVYAIRDENSKQIYVGMTKNLSQRLDEHREKKSFYTKRFGGFRLIYSEECKDYKEGRVREKYLKSGVEKEFLKRINISGISLMVE